MQITRTYDLFITHAWRYHDDWKRLADMIDKHDPRCWRNFSLPWYDPALRTSSESGGRILRENLETQIIPVHAVILLTSVFLQPASRKWLDHEIQIARQYGKPIIALPSWGESNIPDEIQSVTNFTGEWNVKSLLGIVEACIERATATRASS
jgi:hypothetical protein